MANLDLKLRLNFRRHVPKNLTIDYPEAVICRRVKSAILLFDVTHQEKNQTRPRHYALSSRIITKDDENKTNAKRNAALHQEGKN